ncbi:MAG: hypothetical protein HDR54_01715 [Treponema sp.]|nr:hypothetical protein [Treponema sp.]
MKIKEGLKQATEMALPVLMQVFFKNSLINCDFSLRYEIAFSAIQKLKLFSLLKSKEGLKQATKAAKIEKHSSSCSEKGKTMRSRISH